MSYQQYPASGFDPTPQQRPAAPPSIRTAVKVMYAGAVVSGFSFIIGLATIGSLRQAFIRSSRQPLTSTQLHTLEVIGVVVIVILGVLSVTLWLWMAWANGRGRSWARIVAAVLFGLNTLELVSEVVRPAAVGTNILGIVVWLVGLVATIHLWRPDASEYFRQSSGVPGSGPELPLGPPGTLPTYWPRQE